MKNIISILLILISVSVKAQYTPNSGAYQYKGIKTINSIQPPTNTGLPVTATNAPDSNYAAWYYNKTDTSWYYFNPVPKTWSKLSGNGTSSSDSIAGGPFTTSNVQVGFNPGTNISLKQLVQKVWYNFKPPTATLTGGTTLELTPSSTVSQTLNWSAGRQSNTPPLTSIIVAGITETFTQPAFNGTVSGTQNVSVPANTTTVYSNIVTDSSGATATATTTFNFLGKKYYGLVSDTTGIGSGSQDAAILALTSAFASTKTLTVNTGSITGTKYWVYAYPASLSALSALSFNSIPALEAMNTTTRTFTNALGYSQSYIFYWNKQGQTISSDISAQ